MSGTEVMRIILNGAKGPGSNCREATVWFHCNYGLLNVTSVKHGRIPSGSSHIVLFKGCLKFYILLQWNRNVCTTPAEEAAECSSHPEQWSVSVLKSAAKDSFHHSTCCLRFK